MVDIMNGDENRKKYFEMAKQEKEYLDKYMSMDERLTQLFNASKFSEKEYDELFQQVVDIRNKYEEIREERKKLALVLLDIMWGI